MPGRAVPFRAGMCRAEPGRGAAARPPRGERHRAGGAERSGAGWDRGLPAVGAGGGGPSWLPGQRPVQVSGGAGGSGERQRPRKEKRGARRCRGWMEAAGRALGGSPRFPGNYTCTFDSIKGCSPPPPAAGGSLEGCGCAGADVQQRYPLPSPLRNGGRSRLSPVGERGFSFKLPATMAGGDAGTHLTR